MVLFIKLFISIFILVLFGYEIFIFRKYKVNYKNTKKKLKNRYPMEVMIMENFYKVDVDKLNYNKFLNVLAVVSSFDIALIVSVVNLIDIGILQIIVAMILVLPIIFISYFIVSLFYKKKEGIKK